MLRNHNPNPALTTDTNFSAQSYVILQSITCVLCTLHHYKEDDSCEDGGYICSNILAFIKEDKL
jgi:hypothetical protein